MRPLLQQSVGRGRLFCVELRGKGWLRSLGSKGITENREGRDTTGKWFIMEKTKQSRTIFVWSCWGGEYVWMYMCAMQGCECMYTCALHGCVCTSVCMCVCVYVHMCNAGVCACTCVWCTCVCMHLLVCTCASVNVCACVYVHVCVHVCICTCVNVCVHVCPHRCMCVHVCLCTHMCWGRGWAVWQSNRQILRLTLKCEFKIWY